MALHDDESIVMIDWKAVGNDYLAFFPEHYPDLPFLSGDAWEALCDDLAHEMVDTVFDALSGYLAEHGHELWNVDDSSDSYHLAIVKHENAADFERTWNTVCVEEGFSFDLSPERVGLAGAAAVASEPSAANDSPSATKQRTTLIADTDWHCSYGGFDLGQTPVCLVDYETDEGEFRGLADFRCFPYEILDADAIDAIMDDKRLIDPIFNNEHVQYWAYEPPGDNKHRALRVQHIVRMLDVSTGVMNVIEGTKAPLDHFIESNGCDDTLFVTLPAYRNGTINTHRKVLASIRGDTCTPLEEVDARMEGPLALSRDEVLLSKRNNDGTRVIVWNATTGQRREFPPLPFELRNAFSPATDEICFATETRSRHREADHIEERTGHLVRLNLADRRLRRAKLEGLYNEFRFDPSVLKDQPRPSITIRSFEGAIRPSRGHDGWMVLNYVTSHSGKFDLAWLWHPRTDEVIKIHQKDFPRLTPTLHYMPHLGRYLATDGCRVDLVVPFDDISRSRLHARLDWHDVAWGD